MIGSKRKRETVFANLRASGVDEQKLGRVHAPIGIEIGAETPQEIAVSILAQIIQVRAQRDNSSDTDE
jgi:xanthine dehydrogenase accessory factor